MDKVSTITYDLYVPPPPKEDNEKSLCDKHDSIRMSLLGCTAYDVIRSVFFEGTRPPPDIDFDDKMKLLNAEINSCPECQRLQKIFENKQRADRELQERREIYHRERSKKLSIVNTIKCFLKGHDFENTDPELFTDNNIAKNNVVRTCKRCGIIIAN